MRIHGNGAKETAMPTYEYKCNSCNETYSLFVMRLPREAEKKCPHCGSGDVKQVPAATGGFIFGNSGGSCGASFGAFG